MRCWPVGRPRVWSACSREKRKMRVSLEMVCLEWRGAVVQARGRRKMERGDDDEGDWLSPSLRRERDLVSRVPMW